MHWLATWPARWAQHHISAGLPSPVEAGPYPAGFVIRLAPFCAATVEHFKFLERPSNQAIPDGLGFEPPRDYERQVPDGRLSSGPRDYATVGQLYETFEQPLQATAAALGEQQLFVGNPALQVDATLAPLPGVAPVTNLASALVVIRTIVTQGEGSHQREVTPAMNFANDVVLGGAQMSTQLRARPQCSPQIVMKHPGRRLERRTPSRRQAQHT